MYILTCIRHLLLTGVATLGMISAQNPQIRRILDQASIKYTVDKDGDFKMTFDVGDGRTQLVFVMSSVEEIGGQSIVQIWSPAYRGPEISKETLAKLAVDGRQRKVGGWEVTTASDQIFAVFKAKIPLSALTPDFMRSVCAGVAGVADQMEKDSMGSDNF
ncbi:MAG: hypothetical protein N2170_04610 [Bacteroidia bacterium]|nr:hypothetical protein [Bacteroidia bacterium]